ncbi:MAG: hypothetical protein OXU92_03955 [Deltaproteobacteria bacterium]|nr:hypothetical protein [Deltaproteobacteria bacterium]
MKRVIAAVALVFLFGAGCKSVLEKEQRDYEQLEAQLLATLPLLPTEIIVKDASTDRIVLLAKQDSSRFEEVSELLKVQAEVETRATEVCSDFNRKPIGRNVKDIGLQDGSGEEACSSHIIPACFSRKYQVREFLYSCVE